MTATLLHHHFPRCIELLCIASAAALVIEPGVGLICRNGGSSAGSPPRLVVFEHTEAGTGALVWNQPSPVFLGSLSIPRFSEFPDNPLMLGCGTDLVGSSSTGTDIAVGDMSPWFWLHNVPGLSGSYRLDGAKGPLFMGGNIDKASELIRAGVVDPKQFKFFWKYKAWQGGDALENEIHLGLYDCIGPQDPTEALQPFSMSIFP